MAHSHHLVENFRIDLTNIRGLRANFLALDAHTRYHKPCIMAVNETQVCQDADSQDFHIPDYCLLPLFVPHRGLALFIRNDIAFQIQQQYNITDPEFTAQWVKLRVNKQIIHFCFLYRSPNCSKQFTFDKFDNLSDSITSIQNKYPNSEIIVAGDFNIHNKNWLTHSSHNSPEGLYVELFAESNLLTQMVKEPTHIPCVEGQFSNTLDLFLTTHPEKIQCEGYCTSR